MARTPLMRALGELASVHAEAQRRGMKPQQVREERAAIRAARAARYRESGGLSRRDFLAGTAALGAAAALGATATRPRATRAAGNPVAIVGGGIAGLTAARILADNGVDSVVYEAKQRVGGRIYSDTTGWVHDQVTEWGGELIDTGHKTMLMLARRFRLPRVALLAAEPNGSEDTFYFDGHYYPKEEADRDFMDIHQALQRDVSAASYPTTFEINTLAGVALDRMSIYEWIESRVPRGHRSPLGQLLDVAYNIEFGAETTVQSSLNMLYLLGYNASPGNFAIFGSSDERYHIVGGNQRLPVAIYQSLPTGSVKLGWRLTAIERSGAKDVALEFATAAGSRTVVARDVILTLPFAVLRSDVDYSGAGFDALKIRAIEELGRGHNGKLHAQFRSRFWNTDGPWPKISNGASYSDTGYQNTWDVSRGQPGTSGILVNYTGGSVTDSLPATKPYSDIATDTTGAVSAATATFLRQIEPVYPGLTSRWNGRATLSVPHLDRDFKLSYSHWRVGQYTRFGGYEGVPQRNIHFAGEHTSVDFQGWMEGGAITGIRAANEVLAG